MLNGHHSQVRTALPLQVSRPGNTPPSVTSLHSLCPLRWAREFADAGLWAKIDVVLP